MIDAAELNTTEKQLRDALERLVAQNPTNIGLRQKLKANKLKLVVSNVEKEAGLANGAAKRYPKTKALSESYSWGKQCVRYSDSPPPPLSKSERRLSKSSKGNQKTQ